MPLISDSFASSSRPDSCANGGCGEHAASHAQAIAQAAARSRRASAERGGVGEGRRGRIREGSHAAAPVAEPPRPPGTLRP